MPISRVVWGNNLPPKCKFFLWLLTSDKLPTRERLFRRYMTSASSCPFCPAEETRDHLFRGCAHAAQFWATLGLPEINSVSCVCDILTSPFVWGSAPSSPRTMAVTSVLWNIWKSRNLKVFQDEDTPLVRSLQSIASDIMLWSHRLTRISDKTRLKDWGDLVLNVI